jgi:histidyl-tRNA synthetase
MFSGKQIPAVGVSIGIERIFNILEKYYKNDDNLRSTYTDVLVCSAGKKFN